MHMNRLRGKLTAWDFSFIPEIVGHHVHGIKYGCPALRASQKSANVVYKCGQMVRLIPMADMSGTKLLEIPSASGHNRFNASQFDKTNASAPHNATS